jgi:hypothetical protein
MRGNPRMGRVVQHGLFVDARKPHGFGEIEAPQWPDRWLRKTSAHARPLLGRRGNAGRTMSPETSNHVPFKR